MRFDAYSATIRDRELRYVVDAISDSVGGVVEEGPRLRRYGETVQISVDGDSVGWVGFDQGNGFVFAEGKGIHSPRWAKSIRMLFPGHTVARADVSEDYDEEGAFDRLRDLVSRAKGPRVYSGYNKKPDDPSLGTTWEVSKRGSPAYLRLYEKGKQPENLHLSRPNWARLEGEFRPHIALHKQLASQMEPIHFWGLTAWSSRVGQAVTTCPITRFEAPIRRYSHDKTTLYLARTFRRYFEEQFADGIDVMRTFQEVWKLDDQASQGFKDFGNRHRSE